MSAGAQPNPPRRQIPILIALGIGFSWLFVVVFALAMLSALVDLMLFGGIGRYAINDTPVSPREFLRTGATVFSAVALFFGVVAWGLQRRRSWSRYLILVLWLAQVPYAVWTRRPGSETEFAALGLLAFAAFSAWYLFRKRNVVAYFADAPVDVASDASPQRPTGITLLALFLALVSVGGFGNAAASLLVERPLTFHPTFPAVAFLYGVTGAVSALGLWRLAPWAPRAFLAYCASAALTLLVFALSLPLGVGFGGGLWVFAAGSILMAMLLGFLYRYTRAAVAPQGAHGERTLG